MTQKTLLFCDSCLKDIPGPGPGECFPRYIVLSASGDVGLDLHGGTKHFCNADCLHAFLAEVTA